MNEAEDGKSNNLSDDIAGISNLETTNTVPMVVICKTKDDFCKMCNVVTKIAIKNAGKNTTDNADHIDGRIYINNNGGISANATAHVQLKDKDTTYEISASSSKGNNDVIFRVEKDKHNNPSTTKETNSGSFYKCNPSLNDFFDAFDNLEGTSDSKDRHLAYLSNSTSDNASFSAQNTKNDSKEIEENIGKNSTKTSNLHRSASLHNLPKSQFSIGNAQVDNSENLLLTPRAIKESGFASNEYE
ncbi:MAG: hypothetical protein LBB18_02085 [Puniceicoccales bacterium]|jgi:hypothetical protein|nr:hypothetical protein [Puniceicoccales bacterium]